MFIIFIFIFIKSHIIEFIYNILISLLTDIVFGAFQEGLELVERDRRDVRVGINDR